MPSFSETFTLPYSPEAMFALVADVDNYSEFLPWCQKSVVLERSSDLIIARLDICFGPLKQSYTSRIELHREQKEIIVSLVQGPFNHLYNAWKFVPWRKVHTQVEFDIDFSFKSRLFEKMISSFFDKAINKMIDAFLKRAEKLFGDVPYSEASSDFAQLHLHDPDIKK